MKPFAFHMMSFQYPINSANFHSPKKQKQHLIFTKKNESKKNGKKNEWKWEKKMKHIDFEAFPCFASLISILSKLEILSILRYSSISYFYFFSFKSIWKLHRLEPWQQLSRGEFSPLPMRVLAALILLEATKLLLRKVRKRKLLPAFEVVSYLLIQHQDDP